MTDPGHAQVDADVAPVGCCRPWPAYALAEPEGQRKVMLVVLGESA
jgi:hypothetical protein